MQSGNSKKFAIVSQVIPPDLNGQAVVLGRILDGYQLNEYCLISNEIPNSKNIKHSNVFYIHNTFGSKKTLIPKIIKVCIEIAKRANQIKKIIKEQQCGIVIACTGDLFNLPATYIASRLTGISFVPYIFDDYVYQWTGLRRLCAKFLEPFFVKASSGLITPNEFLQMEYSRRYGRKAIIIRNPAPEIDTRKISDQPSYFDKQQVNIVYTGSVYHAHFDAFKNLVNSINEINSDGNKIALHVFTPQLESQLTSEGIFGDNVFIHEPVRETQVFDVLLKADILFLPLAFNSPIPEVIRTSSPGKMGDYLSAGKAIVVHTPEDSFVSWFFYKYDCGVVVSNDTTVLKQKLIELIESNSMRIELGTKAGDIAKTDFSLKKIQAMFKEFLDSVRGSI